MVVTILLKCSVLNLTPPMNVLDLFEYADDKVIAKSSASPMIVLDLLKALNHKTTVDVMKVTMDVIEAVVGAVKALSFSVVL